MSPRRLVLLSVGLGLLNGCVLDRTGQSATAAYERELAAQKARADELERLNADLERRLVQLDEVVRYRGQQEAEKLENLDQVRDEVRRLRGELETGQHEADATNTASKAFREDAQFRLEYMELRVATLEKALGVKPPAAPIPGGQVAVAPPAGGGEITAPVGPPKEVELAATPDDLIRMAEESLKANQPVLARAQLERFLRENPNHARAVEARYRLAETYYNEKNYKSAALKFDEVATQAPDSVWAPWAMVRQGECFKAMGNNDAAKLFWEDVVAKYPKSKAAKEAKTLLGS
ncbi:MAG: tetratricopeptide repeat protein [Deltaproteobacteria bacterium]|nr:tetratricopeptide repeat protein [Deltaproteobacteria bacterium]